MTAHILYACAFDKSIVKLGHTQLINCKTAIYNLQAALRYIYCYTISSRYTFIIYQ